jgi:hypothetical protein
VFIDQVHVIEAHQPGDGGVEIVDMQSIRGDVETDLIGRADVLAAAAHWGLIRSKYERNNHGWGDQWRGYDPTTRADCYTRLSAGLFATAVDDAVDFNCRSAREEGICFGRNCSDNLRRFRNSLLLRRAHERLACPPFNRLLPTDMHH